MALKKIKRTQTRKGQVMVDKALNPIAVWEFNADIFVITHSTTISCNYGTYCAAAAYQRVRTIGNEIQ